MPKYFKQNNPIIKIGMDNMTPETMMQYMREERTMIAARLKVEGTRVSDLLRAMKADRISTDENVIQLRKELSIYYEEPAFLQCGNMGQIVEKSLEMLTKKPDLYKE